MLWSPIGDNWTHPVDEVLLWKSTGRTVDASGQFLSRIWLQNLSSLSLVNMTCTSGPREDRVRSMVLYLLLLPVLTGHVQSRQGPRPVR
jgi:hypothetical protein